MYLEQNCSYLATLKLSWIERVASNNVIANKFTDVGFKDVVVTGDGAERKATGLWPGNSMEVELPKQVNRVLKL